MILKRNCYKNRFLNIKTETWTVIPVRAGTGRSVGPGPAISKKIVNMPIVPAGRSWSKNIDSRLTYVFPIRKSVDQFVFLNKRNRPKEGFLRLFCTRSPEKIMINSFLFSFSTSWILKSKYFLVLLYHIRLLE